MFSTLLRWLSGAPSLAAQGARELALQAAIMEARAALSRFTLSATIKPTGLLALKREIDAAPEDARIEEREGQLRIFFADGREMRCGEKFLARRNPSGEFSIEIFQSDGEKLIVGRAADGGLMIEHSLPELTAAIQDQLERALAEALADPAFNPPTASS